MQLRCDFCPRECLLGDGEVGFCSVRKNQDGKLVTLVYGHLVAAKVELMQDKSFYHFMPSSRVLSIALYGCNYNCQFCQNYLLTQPQAATSGLSLAYARGGFGSEVTPSEVVLAMKQKECFVLCYSFTEPAVWQDYMIEVATLVKASGYKNALITNGFFTRTARRRVIPLMDAINIDFKGDEKFYHNYCNGSRAGVIDTIIDSLSFIDKDVEVTTLAIEGLHSHKDIIKLGQELFDIGVPVWQIRRFFPHYKMKDRLATSKKFLDELRPLVKQEVPIPHIYIDGVKL